MLTIIAIVILAICLAYLAAARRERAAHTGGDPGIEWETNCIPHEALEACREAVGGAGFGPIACEEAARRVSEKYGVRISEKTAAAIRTMDKAVEAKSARRRLYRDKKKIIRNYHAYGIVKAAMLSEVPPMSVLTILKNPTAHDRAAAEEADLGSRMHCGRIMKEATQFEETVGRYLTSIGVRYKTEAEMRGEGSGLTPDFLLSKPVTINGQECTWIDAKNYPAMNHPLVSSSLITQADKYTRAFGPGAFVFSGGVSCEQAPLGALLLPAPM